MSRIKEFFSCVLSGLCGCGIGIAMQFVIYTYNYAMWEKRNCLVMGNENIQHIKICKDGLLSEKFTYTLSNDEVLELKINVKKTTK